jgi:hypothetical protein
VGRGGLIKPHEAPGGRGTLWVRWPPGEAGDACLPRAGRAPERLTLWAWSSSKHSVTPIRVTTTGCNEVGGMQGARGGSLASKPRDSLCDAC